MYAECLAVKQKSNGKTALFQIQKFDWKQKVDQHF